MTKKSHKTELVLLASAGERVIISSSNTTL